MNIVELYELVPQERHSEVVVSGDRLFFDGDEYIIEGEDELRLVHSQKELEQQLTRIETRLSTK
ncbi:MAG TPA: hypothetical protein G4O18_02650 [Dehalococcoidia bacterium]|nr:hypothetical protein [Dehalococcoidia bacterium]